MKKIISIVLALTMLLCMNTTVFAATDESVAGKSYDLDAFAVTGKNTLGSSLGSASSANSLTANYYYENIDEVTTGKFTADAKMAIITVDGFADTRIAGGDIEVTIDGKSFDESDFTNSYYSDNVGYDSGVLKFPVELTKAGYSDTYLIVVSSTDADGYTYSETAKVTVKMVNKSAYKTAKTATISKISGDGVSAYIVGSKIYLDYAASSANDTADMDVTFKDEDGSLFSVVAWAYAPTSDKGANKSIFTVKSDGVKLSDSAANYGIKASSRGTGDYIEDVYFTLETSSYIYETKAYDVVIRTDVYATDPKGIYFAESSKTIAIGESYTPVVLSVSTSKKVDATIDYGSYSTGGGASEYINQQYIDVEDGETVIGTQEGVSYITASYTFTSSNNTTTTYNASSMKIIVTDSGTTTTDTTTTMYVTCRVLNVRKGPGTSYSKTGKLTRGTSVEVVSVANGWAYLSDGTYVCYKYLSE